MKTAKVSNIKLQYNICAQASQDRQRWNILVCHRSLFYHFRGRSVAGQGEVCPGLLFHRRRKTTNLIDNEIHLAAQTFFISKHSAILARRGNEQKARHFRRHFDIVC